MTEHETKPAEQDAAEIEFSGEEDTASRTTPAKDFGSACVIGALAISVAVMSVRLDVPGSVYTAPAVMPLVISLSLLLMALMLGVRAVREGGATDFFGRAAQAVSRFFADYEGRRSLLLMAIVIAYIVLVGSISFDLRMPTPWFVFRLSSYEVISIFVTTLILKLFWRASLLRSFTVSLVTILVLAAIFRYGFAILMPESY
ncbi:MAG: hypothetical protein ACJ0SL_02350 [Candidatus Rariloculaceae bacterium]